MNEYNLMNIFIYFSFQNNKNRHEHVKYVQILCRKIQIHTVKRLIDCINCANASS